MRKLMSILVSLAVFFVFAAAGEGAEDSAKIITNIKAEFAKPAKENRPWVYWFWNNGNITAEGIKADLEAMEKVGIGGVLIMEVGQNAPAGKVDFLSEQWRELFKLTINEAARHGIEVNMNNDAGWNGSGGKWITPELGMQVLTWTESKITKPKENEKISLTTPPKRNNYYKDIAVFALPTPNDDAAKKNINHDRNRRATPNNTAIVAQKDIVDLTGKLGADGVLDWEVPEGEWTILRIGHTSKGINIAPAPTSAAGLECDKLSIKASEEAFNGQMGKLINDNKDLTGVGKTLMSTHIDSWENGSQNWTPAMREEFKERRAYDLWKFLPVFVGYTVDSTEVTDRFLWDFRRTVSEMCLDNYVGTFRRLSHKNGIRLSTEAYDRAPCDFLQFAGISDEPIGEFWCAGGWNREDGVRLNDCRGMASAGHIYGKKIIGAEAFTATNHERWLRHPGNLKSLGDRAFCEGINRLIFHRYSFQPWLDVKPGLMMGPWGIHYERTQTWWNLTPAWHEYLSRCQFMLRQGNFAAEIAYIEPEDSPQNYSSYPKNGYQWDQCNTDVVLKMSVQNGKLILPSGTTYSILVMPRSDRVTLELLTKIKELIEAGATVIGGRPVGSFGLTDYPKKDELVKKLAEQIWGEQNERVGERNFGKGKIIWGKTPENVLAEIGIKPAFITDRELNFIHRQTENADLFFVANPKNVKTTAQIICNKITDKPEIWFPESGKTITAPIYKTEKDSTTILMTFEPTQSVFLVFPKQRPTHFTPAVYRVDYNDEIIVNLEQRDNSKPQRKFEIVSAKYGVLDDPKATVDATETVRKLLKNGGDTVHVAKVTEAVGDPKVGVVKTLKVEFKVGGELFTASGQDGGRVFLYDRDLPFQITDDGFVFRKSGRFLLHRSFGKSGPQQIDIHNAIDIDKKWSVEFVSKKTQLVQEFDRLTAWNDSPNEAIKHFSGTAIYRTKINLPEKLIAGGASYSSEQKKNKRVLLDLGKVEVMAEVVVNGKNVGVLWTDNKVVDVTDALQFGKENEIEIRVTNLWCNRLIGDAALPQDKERQSNGTLSAWPEWLLKGESDPHGRETFCMWNLWKAGETLQPSGLLGPVRVVFVERD
ncbi:MAG: hypothetical protein LBQ66_03535 [Planctomycetaceae bacterium]|jgi:hypothetical protein|nr:hypothetical protein [Planctomycetaceae bacterium]